MARGDIRPDRVRVGLGQQIQVDRMTRRGDGREDVVSVHPLAARRAERGDGKRIEPRGEKADRAVVAKVLVHEGGLARGGSYYGGWTANPSGLRPMFLQIHEERFTAGSDSQSRHNAAMFGSARGGGGRGLDGVRCAWRQDARSRIPPT